MRISTFEKSLKYVKVSYCLIDSLQQQLGLYIRDWLVSMQDHAATNKKFLLEICLKIDDAYHIRVYYIFHTNNNAGNQVDSPDDTTFCHQFRKLYQAFIKYKFSSRKIATKMFGDTVKDSCGVRLFR